MAIQGTYDLAEMAKDLIETIRNSNWAEAIAQIQSLNSLQTLFLVYEMQKQGLETSDLERLALIASESMNDNQVGKGYISDTQELT